jgi:hypothetical protein
MTATAGSGDTLVGTAINRSTNGGAQSTVATSLNYTFTPAAPGTYTFYPRANTGYYGWYNDKSLTVTVADQCPNGSGPVNACTACNNGYALDGAGHCALICPNGSGLAGACTACNSGYVSDGAGNCALQCANGSGLAGSCTACNSGYTLLPSGICAPPSGTFSVTPSSVRVNTATPVTFSWNISNPTGSCTVSGPSGFAPFSFTPTSGVGGSQAATITLPQASFFTLTCGILTSQITVKLVPLTGEK